MSCIYKLKLFVDIVFFKKQTHTHKGDEKNKGFNTKTHHNSTQKSW